MSPQLYLASRSPRRRELLLQIGVQFEVVDIDVAECRGQAEAPQDYVQRLASEKALAGREQTDECERSLPVMGADTIVVLDDQVLEKPEDALSSLAMLRSLSGREHQVLTAVSICARKGQKTRTSSTSVRFRCLTDEEIEAYWHTGEPQGKAGSYAIQGLGAVFVEQIEGSYSGVVGLPIETCVPLLHWAGVNWWKAVQKLDE